IRRRADGVGAATVQAMLGMKEAEKHIAVAHASTQADFAAGLQRLGQRERFKGSAIVGHQICETPVAAENNPAHLAQSLPAGVVGCTITKIKTRPYEIRHISAVVVELVPVRVALERL